MLSQRERYFWLPIEISEIILGSGSNAAKISYRDYIETRAGETRNNIIKVMIPNKNAPSLRFYADEIPEGIMITDGMQWSGSSARVSVLVIEISPDVSPSQYTFEIGFKINGNDYGTASCTIEVIE